MELKIWTPDEKKVEPVRVRLREENGMIVLASVGNGGHTACYLVALLETGRIQRFNMVDPSLGFDLDESGRIKLWNKDAPTGRVRCKDKEKLYRNILSCAGSATLAEMVMRQILDIRNDIFEVEP